ncbi:olfactory receptor 13A1-like [Manis javanica]|uniref:olfactory receptor 13A1-like n=1 Tax=Manis javanica TaxID=9974 RepID=UPI003C6D3485
MRSFSAAPQLRALFFILFLSLYTMALSGNSLSMAATTFTSRLHIPMYLFLVSLAVFDVICASTVVPKLLEMLVAEKRGISYWGCVVQVYFLTWSLAAELLLLHAVAYDRYLAICHSLHYGSIISPRVCVVLAGALWGISVLGAGVNACLILWLTFCGSNVIDHFFCEIPPLLLLSCSCTYVNDIMAIMADIFAMLYFLLTTVSCGFIISTMLKMRTAKGKR